MKSSFCARVGAVTFLIFGLLALNSCLPGGDTITPGNGSGNDSPLYFIGYTVTGDESYRTPCVWKDGSYSPLPTGAAPYGEAWDLCVFDDSVYGAGDVYDTLYYAQPCYWKDGTINVLTTDAMTNGQANGVQVIDGSLYVSGFICDDEYVNCVPGYWKDGSFVKLEITNPSDAKYVDGQACQMTVYSESLYIGGLVSSPLGGVLGCYWKDGVYTELSLPSDSSIRGSMAYKVIVAGGSTYVGGELYNNSADDSLRYLPCYWKDGVCRLLLGNNGSEKFGWVNSMCELDGSLYAIGLINDSTSTKSVPCYWKDDVCYKLALPTNATAGQADVVSVQDHVLVIGGSTVDSSGVEIPCYWENGVYHELFSPSSAFRGKVWGGGRSIMAATHK